MHLLVTGGTGLIGRAFIEKHPEYEYTVLTRQSSTNGTVSGLPAAVHTLGNLNDLTDLNAFDAVINLAGEPIADKRWTHKQQKKYDKAVLA